MRSLRSNIISSLSNLQYYFGICVTILITASWVGATHCIKFLYIQRDIMDPSSFASMSVSASIISSNDNFFFEDFENDTNELFQTIHLPASAAAAPVPRNPLSAKPSSSNTAANSHIYNAPFFTAWFCTNFALLFFPIYLLGRLAISSCSESPGEILGNIIRGFRERGLTAARFLNRCIIFCLLWLITSYLYILSLRALLATDVMALFATNVACAYLLSWVILHEQFVGVRVSTIAYSWFRIHSLFECRNRFPFRLQIVAVILVGRVIRHSFSHFLVIILFGCVVWYRDSITCIHGWNNRESDTWRCCFGCTFSGWIRSLQSICSLLSIRFKFIDFDRNVQVMFRKIMGDPPLPMVAFTFTMLGFINATLCWPISLGLYLTGAEVMPWESLSWIVLLIACILLLGKLSGILELSQIIHWIDFCLVLTVFHILTQFSTAVTYPPFVTLGLITSVPVSAGKFISIDWSSLQ